MSIVFWCAAVPAILVIIRKYREFKWGRFKENVCLEDKVIVVTGASSGIGKETVKELAKRKATIIMGCRDLKKAKLVVEEIRKTIKTGELIPMEVDLESLDSVRNFAFEVSKGFSEIDILINNAGISIPYKKETREGFEINFGVNHLSHFLLTNILLERLKTNHTRVVVVASSLFEKGVIDFDNLQGEKDFSTKRNVAYSNSKLANVYFSRELAERLKNTNIEVFSVCPGFCFTNLFRYSKIKWYYYILFAPVAFFYMRSAKQGSQSILYCALSKDVIGKSGNLFRDCKVFNTSFTFNMDTQKKLWEISEKLVKL